jgi:hypothetical protein
MSVQRGIWVVAAAAAHRSLEREADASQTGARQQSEVAKRRSRLVESSRTAHTSLWSRPAELRRNGKERFALSAAAKGISSVRWSVS